MKQKGRRFYVEEPAKKPKKNKHHDDDRANAVESAPEIESQENFDDEPQVTEKAQKKASDAQFKREQRQKKQISRKLEKSRKKALKESKKRIDADVSDFDVEQIEEEQKVIKFKPQQDAHKNPKKSASGDSRFSDFMSNLKHNKKSVVMSAIILLVLLLTVLIFSNRDRLSFTSIKNWVEYGVLNMNSEESFPVSTNSDVINGGNFSSTDRNLVYASDTRYAVLNNYGKTVYTNPQAFSNPVMAQAADSDLALVYNLGGTGFCIYNLDSQIYASDAEDNIVVADIAKNGTYALVTEKDGYLSKLYVYSDENKQIFAYSFADYYITSVSLDNKGKTVVLSGISAHDGTQMSAVYVLDFTKEEPVVFKEFENNILYYVDHISNRNICIIGETATYTLNMLTRSFKETLYEGKTLTAFDVNTDTNNFVLSLSRSADGRKCDILVFTSSGKLRKTITTELKITSLSTFKNRVAALCSGTVYLFSKEGVSLSQTDAGLDPHAVELYSTTDAYILGVSEIRRIDL